MSEETKFDNKISTKQPTIILIEIIKKKTIFDKVGLWNFLASEV